MKGIQTRISRWDRERYCELFRDYVASIRHRVTIIAVPDRENPIIVPYKSRFLPTGARDAKKRLLDMCSGIGSSVRRLLFVSLTLSYESHNGDVRRAWDVLKRGWSKTINNLRQYDKHLKYVWVYEAHKTGLPHLHAVISTMVPKINRDLIRHLWYSKYRIGGKWAGAHVRTVRQTTGATVFGYISKYLVKLFSVARRTKEEEIFYAVCWFDRHRLFGCSLGLGGQKEEEAEKRSTYLIVSGSTHPETNEICQQSPFTTVWGKLCGVVVRDLMLGDIYCRADDTVDRRSSIRLWPTTVDAWGTSLHSPILKPEIALRSLLTMLSCDRLCTN